MLQKSAEKHIPVLLHELISSIDTTTDGSQTIVDCTLGMWGHAKEILKKLRPWDIFIGFDADKDNLIQAQENLKDTPQGVKKIFIHSNYLHIEKELQNHGISQITGIYYDLWLSSLHLDEAQRGFSFRLDGPLDMRLDKTSGITAQTIVNNYDEKDLERVFIEYGEEPKSRLIAKKIVSSRKKQPFTSTWMLAQIIEEVSFHPQTKARIFQAIRIEVNQELQNLEKSLSSAVKILKKWGNIFVISFHSLEDRIVKHFFKRESSNCICSDVICTCHHTKQLEIISKKPILPTQEEMKSNPRSKSAKARHAKKI